MRTDRDTGYLRKPDWLKIKLPDLRDSGSVIRILGSRCLNTICESGLCPNRGECWGQGTATFMICGDVCTRSCKFCAVKTGNPKGVLNEEEVGRIVDSIKDLKLSHIVLTSVDRDDLPDYGASHWVRTIAAIKSACPGVTMETLIPDFNGRDDLVDEIVAVRPEVISHNMETVERLTPRVRCKATYLTSLHVIERVASQGVRAKSGFMLGLGENENDILSTMDDLLKAGCEVLTIGQYLQPSERHYRVREYITPQKFEEYRKIGLQKGFRFVESGVFVRSSYHAERHVS